MPRPKKNYQTKKKVNNDETENNNNIESPTPNGENTYYNLFNEAESPPSNLANTSNAFPTTIDTSSDIPLGVKRYIDMAFEKQTLELKTILQRSQSGPLLPYLENDSDTINNQNIDRLGFRNHNNKDNHANHDDNNDEHIERRTSKRSAVFDHNNNTNNNINDNGDNINNNNKKNRTSQGKRPHTNSSEPLQDAENMLQAYMHGYRSHATFSFPKLDAFSLRPPSHSLPPIQDQNNLLHAQDNSAISPPNLPWLFQTYNPIDYKDPNYDPTSELDQIINPIAKETERTRLWWTTNFKKEGWNRILNKPSKPANIPRSVWQTIAYNQFMDLMLLSQISIENYNKANNNTFDTNLDDDTRTVVIVQSSQTTAINTDLAFHGQTRKSSSNLYFYTWHEWYMAWKLYMDLVLIIYPHRVGELHGYVSILTEFSKDFNIHAVMRYDRDRRIKLAEKRESTLLDREPSVEGKHFTAAAARIQYIPRQAHSYIRSSNFRSASSRTIFHEGIPICKEFNRKEGCKRDICRFQHVCLTCRLKSHGESACYRLQQNKSPQPQSSSKPHTDPSKH